MIDTKLKKILLATFISLFCVSLAVNAWMGYQLSTALRAYNAQQNDAKVLAFTGMFVEDVLMANKEIDFDTMRIFLTSGRDSQKAVKKRGFQTRQNFCWTC